MSGIYIHIPFCKQACHYCDFHFSTSVKLKSKFIEALLIEIELRKDYLSSPVKTIYFGGGTPSLLSEAELNQLFESLYKNFNIDANAEVTFEANPDDLLVEKIEQLSKTPINRLSIGIQSFRNEDLKFMHRAHTAEMAKRAVVTAQDNGFSNITIDLIYGIPGLDNLQWQANLSQAFALNVQHISSYALTVEPKTALAHFIDKGKLPAISDLQSAAQFEILIGSMRANGFLQYEISNFSKPGFESKHNSNYWRKAHYLGLGPSAHSFDGNSRQWNVRNNPIYIESLISRKIPCEREELSIKDHYNEYILTSLRTRWGADLGYIRTEFPAFNAHFLKVAQSFISSGDIIHQGSVYVLSDAGKLIADQVARELFSD